VISEFAVRCGPARTTTEGATFTHDLSGQPGFAFCVLDEPALPVALVDEGTDSLELSFLR